MKNLIDIKGLTKDFKNVRAVDNISFEVKKGEIVGLLGPNGAGKTTTLQMLLGLTTPTSGNINLFGLDLKRDRREILQRVNFSSSYISMPFSLTVEENLFIFAKLYNIKAARKKIDDLLKIFEIEELRGAPIRRLSSGQVTRVCLAKSLLNDPEVLFLDEPTASLDPDIADKTRSLLKYLREERDIAMLLTSHNMAEMEEMCDRIIFLDRGNIIATGKPEEIKEKFQGATLEEVFLKIARTGV